MIRTLPLNDYPQEDLDRRRDALALKLEAIRGLKFKEPLKVREASRRDYAEFALENARLAYGRDLEASGKGLKALGLVGSKVRVELALSVNAGIGVKVFCAGGELRLLDRAAGDDWWINKMNLGLVDQHYKPAIADTYDAQMAFAALRMGDAEITKHHLWHGGKLPAGYSRKLAEEAAAWEKGNSRFASALFPRVFIRTGDFTWRRGGPFAAALHAEGGFARVDRAYGEPPVSTEQVLHPEKYLKGEKPQKVDLSPAEEALRGAGYKRIYRTVMGELGTALVLESHLMGDEIPAASEGWGGDAFEVHEKTGAPPLVLWATRWDRDEDATEFHKQAAAVLLALGLPEEPLRNVEACRGDGVVLMVNVPSDLDKALLAAAWKALGR